MSKPSVVFFASHAHGGIRELWTNLAEGFHELGYDAQLVGLYPLPGSLEPPTNILAWSYILPAKPTGIGGKAALAKGMVQWLRRAKPDIIISSMPAANVLVALLGRIFSPHTQIIISHHSPSNVYHPLLNALDHLGGSAGNVKAIVSVSDAVDQTLNNKPAAYRKKRMTIHNAIPPRIERFLDELGQRARTQPPGRRVVVSGRLEKQKNHPMLIRAAALMKDVEIDILGGGPDKEVLEALMISLGVRERIHLLGNRNRDEALELLARGDVFVQVSLFEGHSLALIEAAQLGLPLIVSNVPSQTEAVTAKDGTVCGLVVDLDDYQGLANAVHRVLDDPAERQRLIGLSKKLATECTFDQMINQYVRLTRLFHSSAAVPSPGESAGSTT